MTRLEGKQDATGWVEDPVLRHRLRFTRSDGEQQVEIWVDPGGGVTPHVHPGLEERFEVLEGRPGFLSGRGWREAGPGDTVVVPAGVRHSYRNRQDAPVHMVCHVTPPSSSLQEFLEEVAALSRAGRMTRRGLPKSPSAALAGLSLLRRHREMVRMRPLPLPTPRRRTSQ